MFPEQNKNGETLADAYFLLSISLRQTYGFPVWRPPFLVVVHGFSATFRNKRPSGNIVWDAKIPEFLGSETQSDYLNPG